MKQFLLCLFTALGMVACTTYPTPSAEIQNVSLSTVPAQTATVAVNTPLSIRAILTGCNDQRVQWSVQDPQGAAPAMSSATLLPDPASNPIQFQASQPGTYQVRVHSVAFPEKVATVMVTVTGAADQPPTVTISSPAAGSTIPGNNSFVLSGTATDDKGISKLTFQINGGTEQDLSINNGSRVTQMDVQVQYSKTLSSTLLNPGNNTLTVNAYDSSNQKSSTQRTVVLDVPPAAADRPVVLLGDSNMLLTWPGQQSPYPFNTPFLHNLLVFPAKGTPRDSGTQVVIDSQHSFLCSAQGANCAAAIQGLKTAIAGQGFSALENQNLTSLPLNVRVVVLLMPSTRIEGSVIAAGTSLANGSFDFSGSEISGLQSFVATGGRLIIVSDGNVEHASQFAINTTTGLLKQLKTDATLEGENVHCLDNSNRANTVSGLQTTQGISQLHMQCSEAINLGPNDLEMAVGSGDEANSTVAALLDIHLSEVD